MHNLVEAEVRARLGINQDKNMLTIDAFTSKLSFKIFESFFELLANEDSQINQTFRVRFKGYDVRKQELRKLLRNEPLSRETFIRQLDDSMLVPGPPPVCDVLSGKSNYGGSSQRQRTKARNHAR